MPAAMFGDVVVSAKRREVVFGWRITIGDCKAVVELYWYTPKAKSQRRRIEVGQRTFGASHS